MTQRKILSRAFIALLALAGVSATTASQANTIQVLGPDNTTVIGTVTDGTNLLTFDGLLAPPPQPNLSPTFAQTFNISPANPTTEAAQLNLLAGTNFLTGVQTQVGNDTPFVIGAGQYFSLKIDGPNFGTAYFLNLDGPLSLTYTQLVSGAGLSHVTTYGSAVPEPATWGMMLLGFAGLAFAFRQSRRKVSFA